MQPLANKIRPQTLDEYVGQEHLIGNNKDTEYRSNYWKGKNNIYQSKY